MRFLAELRHLLRGRRYRQLLAVRVTSQTFDGVFQAGLASYVLFSPEDRPDAPAIAAALAALLLPFSLLGPFVGVFLDRWRRRQVLVYANLVRTAPVLLVAALVAAGVRGGWLFATVLVALSINRFLLAGLSASLPHVVTAADLVLANAVTPTCGTLAFVVGVGLASAARGALPMAQPDVIIVTLAAVGYLAAALIARRIPVDLLGPDLRSEPQRLHHAIADVLRGLVNGLRHLRSRPAAAHALGVIAAHRFLYGLTTVATVLLYRNYFDPSDTDAALAGLAGAVVASGAGFLLAAILTPIATDRVSPPTWMVTLLALAAAVELMPGLLFTPAGTLVAAFALGLSAQGVKICVDTLVQLGVDDEFRGRVFSLYDVIFNVVFVAAAAVGALVIPANGKSYPLVVAISIGYAATAIGYHLVGRNDLPVTGAISGNAAKGARRTS